MKKLIPFILIGAIHASAQTGNYVNFIRQHQQGNGIVWDMPVDPIGAGPAALTLESDGALFQLWTIEQTAAKEYLLDQKIVNAYLPTADIKVTTLDPYARVARTRVDQPFTVEINITGLLSGLDLPPAASSVLMERHLAAYQAGQPAPEAEKVLAGTPFSSSYLTANGKMVLRFEASALTAEDPTKASGEEYFAIRSLTDGSVSPNQLASGVVQVWAVASGSIKGIANGDQLRFQIPQLELLLNDLYPRSDTYLLLFEGTQVTGTDGTVVKAFPMDCETCESRVIGVSELDSKITNDGTYTLALVSDTVFGRELLGPTVTFSVNRTLHVNAMMVDFSDDTVTP
jgi:hypothetical protein